MQLTLKEPGGRRNPPPSTFFVITQPVVISRAETSWLFPSSLALDLRAFFFKIGPRVMTRRCVIERWVQRKTDQKLIFNGNYTQIVFFVVVVFFFFFLFCFVFRIHFHYVLSYLFGLFGVRTYVSILWHTSLPKNATFAWKNSEKPWFWRFWWISCFWHDVTYDALWRHTRYVCTFLVPIDSGGS